MYKCSVCGGFVEELGDMAVSSGGCVCAQEKAKESENNLQQLQAEIRALVEEFRELYDGDFGGEAVSLLLTKLHELSAVRQT